MKFFSKVLFVFLVSFGCLEASNYISPEKLYSGIHKYYKYSNNIAHFVLPMMTAINMVKQIAEIPNFPDAPENIKDFCRKKFIAQGLNPDTIQIKEKEGDVIGAYFNYSFLMNHASMVEFSEALKEVNIKDIPCSIDQQDKSDKIVKLYSTLIDHEIAHLKNNDSRARLLALGGVSMVGAASSWFIRNLSSCRFLFEKPANIKELFTMVAAYTALSVSTGLFSKCLLSLQAQYQEKRADAYAITQATDPEALRVTAAWCEGMDQLHIDFLCGAPINPNLPFTVRYGMNFLRDTLILRHQSKGQTEEFSTWVKKQTKSLALLKFMIDPEHPTGASRAQLFYKAANVLEAKINSSL